MKKDFETNKKEAMDLYYKMLERESKARFINGIWTGVILSMLAIFLTNTAFGAELSDYHILVKNCVYEAAGEPLNGKIEVTRVVLNRVGDKRFPSSIKEVIYFPKAFSWTLNNDLRHIKYEESIECEKAVKAALLVGPSKYNHYFAHKEIYPGWAKEAKDIQIIDNHTFVRL